MNGAATAENLVGTPDIIDLFERRSIVDVIRERFIQAREITSQIDFTIFEPTGFLRLRAGDTNYVVASEDLRELQDAVWCYDSHHTKRFRSPIPVSPGSFDRSESQAGAFLLDYERAAGTLRQVRKKYGNHRT